MLEAPNIRDNGGGVLGEQNIKGKRRKKGMEAKGTNSQRQLRERGVDSRGSNYKR